MGIGTNLRMVGLVTGALLPSTIFGSELFAWYKADTGVTNSGASSMGWADQSGNGYNLSKQSSSYYPSLVTSVQNGLSVVEFTGTSADRMYLSTGALGTTLAQPLTIFWSGCWTSSYSVYDMPLGGWSGNDPGFYRKSANSVEAQTSTGGAQATSASITPNTWHEWAGVFNGSSTLLQCDGSTVATGNSGTYGLTGIELGGYGSAGSNPCQCNIGEVVIASVAASSLQLSQMHGYLSGRWGTP